MRFSGRAVAIVLAAGLSTVGLRAQSPEFEVATVKPNHGNGDFSPSRYPTLRNGRLNADNVSLKTLLGVAYGLSTVRITGPAWIDSDRFDLAGKAPEGIPDSALPPMLQRFLKDRFQSVVHQETRTMLVYEMTLKKSGLKIHPFDPAHPAVTPRNQAGSLLIGVGTMPQIADALARATERPVVDRTKVAGRFTYILSYSPDVIERAESSANPAPPDIFTAVQQQLGIRLRSKKAPVGILVVDHAERTPVQD